MSKHAWTPEFYGSLGKQAFYLDTLHWSEHQYLSYRAMCILCCQLFIAKDMTAQRNSTRIITAALRKHILGAIYDPLVTQSIVAEDVDKFYHTTIFGFNSALEPGDCRASSPCPVPTTNMTATQLQQMLQSTTLERDRTRSNLPDPDVRADVVNLPGSLEGLNIHNTARKHDLFAASSSTPVLDVPPIYPTWNASHVSLHVVDSRGADLFAKKPCELPLGRLRGIGQAPLAGDDTVDANQLDFSQLERALEAKCNPLGIDRKDMCLLSVRRQSEDGSKQKFMTINDEWDLDTAFRRYQEVCSVCNLKNNVWHLYLVSKTDGYDLEDSDTEDARPVDEPQLSPPQDLPTTPPQTTDDAPTESPRGQKRTHATSSDGGTAIEESRKRHRGDQEDCSITRWTHINDLHSDDSQDDASTSGDGPRNAVDVTSVGPTSPSTTTAAPPPPTKTPAKSNAVELTPPASGNINSTTTELKSASQQAWSIKLTYDSQNADKSLDSSRTIDTPDGDAVAESADQWTTWDLDTWAAKGLSLNKRFEITVPDASAQELGDQFDSVDHRQVTEQLSKERLIEFHDVFQLPDNRPVYRDSRYPIPGTASRAAIAYQALSVLFLESLNDHFLGGLLADMQGLGKTFQVLFMIVRRRYRNAVWRDIEEDRRRATEAAATGAEYTRIHLPENYDPCHQVQQCPMHDRRPYECPCEKKSESKKSLDDGFSVILSLASATRDPWVNEWKAWFEAADDIFENVGFKDMGFLLEDKRPFKLVIAHESSLKSEKNKQLYGLTDAEWRDLHFSIEDRAGQKSMRHKSMVDHVVILTTHQSSKLLLKQIGEPLARGRDRVTRHRHRTCWPRWMFVDEAHTYKNGNTAVPALLNNLAKDILELHRETFEVKRKKSTVHQAAYAPLPRVSVWLLTGTPFAGNFAVDFGDIWLPILEKFHIAAGMSAWDKHSPFAACNAESRHKMTKYYNRYLRPPKGIRESSDEGISYRAQNSSKHVRMVMNALRVFTIKRNNFTRLWGEEVVDLPGLKCFNVVCKMTANQKIMANKLATARLVKAWKEESRQANIIGATGKTVPAKKSTLVDRVSRVPGVPVAASFPDSTRAIDSWNTTGVSGRPKWNLTSAQIGEQNWWKADARNSPYTKYWKDVVLPSHKWAPIATLLEEKLNVPSNVHGGYGKVIVVSRVAANVLFLYHAIKSLAKNLSAKWQRPTPIHVACVVSQVTNEERAAIYERLNHGPDAPVDPKFDDQCSADVLVASSTCFGIGQNMGRARTTIMLEPPLSAQTSLQLPARMRRVGGREDVEAYTILGTGCMADELQDAQNSRATDLIDRILTMKVAEARQLDPSLPPFLSVPASKDELSIGPDGVDELETTEDESDMAEDESDMAEDESDMAEDESDMVEDESDMAEDEDLDEA